MDILYFAVHDHGPGVEWNIEAVLWICEFWVLLAGYVVIFVNFCADRQRVRNKKIMEKAKHLMVVYFGFTLSDVCCAFVGVCVLNYLITEYEGNSI